MDSEPTLENALASGGRLHLIGKDILRFHAVYWPAMLMSAGLPLPERVFDSFNQGWSEDGKSLAIHSIPALVNQYGDAVRYYFLKEIDFGKDGDFNETRFINILNADLANDLGNLLNRTLNMARKYCYECVPNCNVRTFSDSPLKAMVWNWVIAS